MLKAIVERRERAFIAGCAFLMFAFTGVAARQYNPFVWTTYRECSHIYSIAMNMQQVYFGTDRAILRYDRLQHQWVSPISESNGFSGTRAELVAMDEVFNKLWVLSDNTLSIYVPTIAHWEMEIPRASLPLPNIHSIGFARDSVFIAGNGLVYASLRGSFSWHRRNGTIPAHIAWYGEKANISVKDYPFLTPYYAADPYFNKYPYTAAAVDNKDMWLGTHGYGVFYFNTFTWNGTHYFPGLGHNRVDALFFDGDGFWTGGQSTQGKGFVHINLLSGEAKRFRAEDIYGIVSDDVLAITGNEQYIWLGTTQGLLQHAKEKGLWESYTGMHGLPGNEVLSLQLKAETLFVGTNDGMAMLIQGRSQLSTIDEFSHIPITAFGIHEGKLLIGTDRGVYMRCENAFQEIIDPDNDLGFGVSAIFVDSTTLWFGTIRKGVEVYDTDSATWQEFLPPATISGNYVYALGGNDDFIWVGTNAGISRYKRANGAWRTFTEHDGLAHNQVFAIYVDNEYAWFGTKDGLTRLHYRDPSVPP